MQLHEFSELTHVAPFRHVLHSLTSVRSDESVWSLIIVVDLISFIRNIECLLLYDVNWKLLYHCFGFWESKTFTENSYCTKCVLSLNSLQRPCFSHWIVVSVIR